MKPIHVFDICGTLYNSNTTFDFLEFFFQSDKKYCFYNKVRFLLVWRILNRILKKFFQIDLTRIIALRYLKGYSRIDLLKAARIFYDSFLIGHQNEEIIHKLFLLQQIQKEQIVIVSATLDFIAEIIAERLHCECWHSSKLQYKQDICQGYLKEDLLGTKVEKIFCNPSLLLESVYTDDFSDIPLLDIAKEKYIIVYPKTRSQWTRILKRKVWNVSLIEY